MIRDFDAAIIAVPSDDAVQQALHLARGGGQVLLFAHTKRSVQHGRADLPVGQDARQRVPASAFILDLASICLDEKDLIGSYSSDFTLQAGVARLVFSRRLDVRPLITHRFPLAQTARAVQLASHPAEDSLKIIVSVDVSQLPKWPNWRSNVLVGTRRAAKTNVTF